MEHNLEHNQSWEEGHHHSMKMLLPFIVIPLAFGMMRRMAKHQHFRMHMQAHSRENWENGVPPFFAEWHRRAHAAQEKPVVES